MSIYLESMRWVELLPNLIPAEGELAGDTSFRHRRIRQRFVPNLEFLKVIHLFTNSFGHKILGLVLQSRTKFIIWNYPRGHLD